PRADSFGVCEGDAEEAMSAWVARTLVLVSTLGAILLAAPPARSHEPQGLILFETEGVKTPLEGSPGLQPGETVVTLVILRPRGPGIAPHASAGLGQRLAAAHVPGAADGLIDPYDRKRPATLELGAPAAGAPVALKFGERYAAGAGGIVTFTVEAVTADGKV